MADDLGYLEEIYQISNLFGINPKEKESLDWFRDNVKSIYGRGEIMKMDVIDQEYGKIPKDARPGRMHMFRYSPKGKATLPYYDAFPLVVSIDFSRGSMLGLNLHYLPPKYRTILFKNLLTFNSNPSMIDEARIRVTYDMLKGMSRLRHFRPCIKRYLTDHVRSRVAIIPPKYWTSAVNLPTDSFVKQNRHTVWGDSINKIR